ncbi:hypothetical protein VB773_10930 [Haloarculaceae archaeon H-GB2-1]|nr:hypothetical protein [Haloarculaceae archaeon H-GB1-1]MEA5386507.1 hypothetical protein [Haloarculaceae archaeon H-GB11]MEA5408020.1 hypothetical protein [Haloarculaceae archaeon H-GB2-1]
MLGRRAPWFSAGDVSTEPFSYRAWKWLCQKRFAAGWDADLFDRIDRTDWDALLILDACRYDTVAAVAEFAAVDRAVSPATATPEFLQRAHESGVFEGTTYVSANPQTRKYDPARNYRHVDVAESLWADDVATVPPKPVYEETRRHVEDGDRVVAHTVQPHYPHVTELDGEVRAVPNGLHPHNLDVNQDGPFSIQRVLANGLVDLDAAMLSYEICAKFAWRTACEFAAELSSDGYTVAITSDHGELFGEWGLVEHPNEIPIRQLVGVPWVVFEPPNGETEDRPGEADVEEPTDRLAALGYLE